MIIMLFKNEKGQTPLVLVLIFILVISAGSIGYIIGAKKPTSLFNSAMQQNSKEATGVMRVTDDNSAAIVQSGDDNKQLAPLNLQSLPLGDNKISKSAQKGYIYSCRSQTDGGGALDIGPWINQAAKTYDLTKKLTVDGDVKWPNAKITVTLNRNTRIISGNGLPNHVTGTYPISKVHSWH